MMEHLVPVFYATSIPIDGSSKEGSNLQGCGEHASKSVEGNRLDQDDSTAGLQQKVWFFEID